MLNVHLANKDIPHYSVTAMQLKIYKLNIYIISTYCIVVLEEMVQI